MVRTTIAVDGDIADSLAEEAAKENKTVYALANESLKAVLEVYKDGENPSQVLPGCRLVRMMKELDSVPVPGDLLEKMIKKLYAVDRESILKEWFEEGRQVGEYLRLSAPRVEELIFEARKILDAGALPVKRVEIRAEEKGRIAISAVGAGLSEESTNCVERFIGGIISAYSLSVVESKISKGMVEVIVAPKNF